MNKESGDQKLRPKIKQGGRGAQKPFGHVVKVNATGGHGEVNVAL